jgi:hypothetical protein
MSSRYVHGPEEVARYPVPKTRRRNGRTVKLDSTGRFLEDYTGDYTGDFSVAYLTHPGLLGMCAVRR